MPVWLVALLAAAQVGPARSSTAAPPAGGLAKLPMLTRYVEAEYPPAAFAAGLEGAVTLAIDVDAVGQVQRVEVLGATDPAFIRPALGAACGFQFTPAEAVGVGPVPVRIVYRYGFVIKRAPVQVATASTSTTPAVATRPERPGVPPVNFLGTVKEAGARKPIAYATVEVSIATTATVTRTATETDARGRFAFRGLPPGRHVVTVRAPLFSRFDTKEELREGESIEVLYYVERSERSPYSVVVRGKIEKKEVARRTLRFEEIERLPGTQGDAIRVIQNLPGVARTPFGLGLLVVRGAPPQDTGVFLDGHRMPILFHFGGIGGVTSVVNSRMLEAIDFSPGGFGPEQGRVSAGIVELRTRYAQTDRVHGEAVVDLAGASIFLEGPVTEREEDGAFVLALRRSYIDGLLAGIISLADSSVSLAPRYWDYQARYDRPLGTSKKHMFSLLAYGSDDELVFLANAAGGAGAPTGSQSRTYFHRLNPRFTFTSDKDTRLVISPIFGVDASQLQSSGDPSGNALRAVLKDVNVGVRVDGTLRLLPWLKLAAGADALYFKFDTESELPAFPRAADFPGPLPTDVAPRKDSSSVPAIISSVYAELEVEPIPGLSLWPGVRLDVYDFYADPQPLIDPRLVEGRTKVAFDPRLTARYAWSDELSLKGQVGYYQQPPLPPQLYLNADLPLQDVDQWSAGFEWQIIDRLSLDLQGFYRKAREVPRASNRVEVVNGVIRPVGVAAEGLLRSYGMELLLKLEKRWDLFGWVAYTLSRSELRREDEDWRPNFFTDQTHNLNIVAAYDLGLSWSISARFRYVTGGGLPTTLARWYDADRDQYGRDIGADLRRAPPFHQLDVRIDKRWSFDEWYLEAYLDVQNVYNYTNTEAYAPTFDFKGEVAIPSLPIFPILGVKGVF